MPIYEYQCKSCNHNFDTMHRVDHAEDVPCPECDSTDTGKILHAPAVNFKGAGFYCNDSKLDAKNAAKKRYEGNKYTPQDPT